jgi:hypothetical protein
MVFPAQSIPRTLLINQGLGIYLQQAMAATNFLTCDRCAYRHCLLPKATGCVHKVLSHSRRGIGGRKKVRKIKTIAAWWFPDTPTKFLLLNLCQKLVTPSANQMVRFPLNLCLRVNIIKLLNKTAPPSQK